MRGLARGAGRAIEGPTFFLRTQERTGMANSKSKHIRTKSTRRQKWKARKKRQKAATKSSKK
jgi:hypothetical protein